MGSVAQKVLVVGAGAVGQVFAWYLTRAGASVTFFVKPTHALPEELPMLEQVRRPTVLTGFKKLTSLADVERQEWDQVWLAVPSNVLAEAWLPSLMRATGTCTVVTLAPEGEEHIPAARRVVGSIPFIAWQDPLPGHSGPERLAFYVPPLAAVLVSGPAAAAIRATLRQGGMRSMVVADTAKTGLPISAILVSSIAAIEGVGWALKDFRGEASALAARAARDVMKGEGVGGLWRVVARGPVLRLAFWLGSKVLPFDLETYIEYHFTKVGVQTRVFLGHWVKRNRARGLETSAVEALIKGLKK